MRESGKAKYQFDADLHTTVDKTLLILTVSDQVNNKVYTVDSDKYDASCSDKTLSISLRLDETILKGSLTIEKVQGINNEPLKSDDGLRVFASYPIKLEDIAFTSDTGFQAQVKNAAQGFSTSISIGRSVGSTVVAASGPTIGVSLDKLVSEFTYLRLVNGPALYYPDLFLDFVSKADMLPVQVGASLTEYAKQDLGCRPPSVYTRKDVQCNILSNYGDDLMITGGMLAINIAISLLCYSLLRWTALRKINRKTYLARMVDFLYRNYGIKLFAVKMDGMSLEILVYAMINIPRTTADNRAGAVSIAVSWILITYFVLYVVALIKLIADVKKETASNQRSIQLSLEAERKVGQLLEQVADLNKNKLWILAGVIEEFNLPRKFWYMYSPIITIARALLISILIYVTSDHEIVQIVGLSIVQVANTAWTVTASIKASRYDNIKEAIDNISQVIFLVLKGCSQITMIEATRQFYIGGACTLVLMIMLLNNIIFMIVAMIMVTVTVIKAIKSKCSKKVKNSVATVTSKSPSNTNSLKFTTLRDHSSIQAKLAARAQVALKRIGLKSLISKNSMQGIKKSVTKDRPTPLLIKTARGSIMQVRRKFMASSRSPLQLSPSQPGSSSRLKITKSNKESISMKTSGGVINELYQK